MRGWLFVLQENLCFVQIGDLWRTFAELFPKISENFRNFPKFFPECLIFI